MKVKEKEEQKMINEEIKKDYSHIKLSDIYKPCEGDLVVEAPKLFSELIQLVSTKENKGKIDNMDMVFTVICVGDGVTNYKIGDKVMVDNIGFPINLIDGHNHFQIKEYQVKGKVLNDDYNKIKSFFQKKKEVKIPIITKNYLGPDGKIRFD